MTESDDKRLLFLTNTMGTGGVGNQLYNMSTRLNECGYDIVICSLLPLGRFGEKSKSAGITTRSIEMKNKVQFPVALYRVTSIIKKFDIDIVHTHMFHATILGRAAGALTKTPVISTFHTTFDKNPENNPVTTRDKIYEITDQWSSLNTFVSDAARDRFVNVGASKANKTMRVYNGIDTNVFSPEDVKKIDKNMFSWVSVGTLREQKDHKTLVNAVAHMNDVEQLNKVEFKIIGEGRLRAELEHLTNKMGVSDLIEFKDRVENLTAHLNAADAFVLPSRWEGFGLVVAEAMACELPVVATNTGGPSEIVDDGKTGFLAEKGSAKDLAEKMQTVMDLSPEERDAFGKRGRQRIKDNYSIEQTVSEWMDIYEKYS